jgi:hypothetical protein
MSRAGICADCRWWQQDDGFTDVEPKPNGSFGNCGLTWSAPDGRQLAACNVLALALTGNPGMPPWKELDSAHMPRSAVSSSRGSRSRASGRHPATAP